MKPHRSDQANRHRVEPDPMLPRKMEEERFRGHAGGFITPHRAMLTEPTTASKILGSIVLVLIFFEGWILAMDYVTLAWAGILDFWREVFGWGGYVVMVDYDWGLSIPYLSVESGLPSGEMWVMGAIFNVLLFLVTFLVPKRFLPIGHLLRIVAFFQACAQIFFYFWPEAFPYSASGYIHGMLIAGVFLISIIPILLGFTFYIFDYGIGKKVGLTLLIMVHLILFIPMQYMAHAFFLQHLSLLFLPLLFFIFGLPLEVLIFIGFYTWGASWKNPAYQEKPAPEPRTAGETRGLV